MLSVHHKTSEAVICPLPGFAHHTLAPHTGICECQLHYTETNLMPSVLPKPSLSHALETILNLKLTL